ncbi:hypothetical protein QBC35DRAFT_431918 [Podospora australis]|uniref:Uncharacterized protein n=1 Tax=Podospora australis TaxID=1536484 RepID=A0AAN7AIY6_9PEZI|nr:hypothetical protein QBC35DRAFT_431918 [Podospora australis]
MNFKITTLLTLAATVIAAPNPTPVEAAEVESRAVTLIELWGDSNFLGLKYTGKGDLGYCYNLPGDFNDYITSGKAYSGYVCTTWVDKNCYGTGFSFLSSSKFPTWIDNKSSSWMCEKY